MAFRRSVVEYRTDRRGYRHVDCPGQLDFIKNLVGGSCPVDAAILVVSAADGPMAHTRTQLSLLRLLDIPVATVFLNKVDSVSDSELVDRVEEEVREMLDRCGFISRAIPFVRGSALLALETPGNREASGPFEELLDVLDEMVPARGPESEAPLLVALESVYSDDERGTVVTGTIERGMVAPGDKVVRLGMNGISELVVAGVEKSRNAVEQAVAGDLVELSLPDEAREHLHRGAVIAAPGSIASSSRFSAVAYLLDNEEGGRQEPIPAMWTSRLQIRSAEVDGTIKLPAGIESLQPGEHSEMDIELGTQVALEKTQRFGIKETGRTIGAGVVTGVVQQ